MLEYEVDYSKCLGVGSVSKYGRMGSNVQSPKDRKYPDMRQYTLCTLYLQYLLTYIINSGDQADR